MARMIKNRRCVICGKNNVYMWTIDNMEKVVVTYLCKVHSAPLLEVMNAAGNLPPDEQVPMPERVREPLGDLDVHKRGRREPKMAPLLDWAPPPPPTLPPEPELTTEEKLVKQALADGKTWPQISDTLGIDVLAAVETYGHLWDLG